MNDPIDILELRFLQKIKEIAEVYANSGLGRWFGKGPGGSTTGGGWDRYTTSGKKAGKCGDATKGSSYSACLGKKYVAKLRSKNGRKAIANWVKRKKAAQNKHGRGKKGSSSNGKSPIVVKYTNKEIINKLSTNKNLHELNYTGAVGIHEFIAFYNKATDEEDKQMQHCMQNNNVECVKSLITRVTGMKMDTIKEQPSMTKNLQENNNYMNSKQLHNIVKKLKYQILAESHELVLQQAGAALNKADTAEDFMKGFVGKRLQDLLDVGSFANMYVMNKYGIGGEYDQQDAQVLLNNLWQAATGFINNHVLEPLGKQRKVLDAELHATPQYMDWQKQRALLGKAYRDARNGGSPDADELKKQYFKLNSEDPTLDDYRNMQDDMRNVVRQFHNKALTLKDVLPSSDDTDQDKKNWASVERLYSDFRKNTIKEQTYTTKNLQINNYMTKTQKIKKLIRSIIAEEFKGNPNDAAEVTSNELTAHLSEDSVADDIKDLEALLANPDPTRANDYGGNIENYKKMLRSKIARLKGDESGMGAEYRVRSDEPAPFGYGLDEKGGVKKDTVKKDTVKKDDDKKVAVKALDQTKDGVIDTGDAVVASRKEKIALSTGNKSDAAFYKKIKSIVNKYRGRGA
jgi:hypothetical protein